MSTATLANGRRKPQAVKSAELCTEILERIAKGEPFAAILRSDPTKFPSQSAWNDWIVADKDLAIAHDAAREAGADVIALQALDIIDEQPSVVDGRVDPGHVNWTKARVDTRLKLLAKWHPKRYGDKLTTALTGADGGAIEVKDAGKDAQDVMAIVAAMRQSKRKEGEDLV